VPKEASATDVRPVMCACVLRVRPMVLSLLLGEVVNDCPRCGGVGWVANHDFCGKALCEVCGWPKETHARPA
jgi:hypothetical protein